VVDQANIVDNSPFASAIAKFHKNGTLAKKDYVEELK